ncbi:hypothetical protein EV356DRAFT_454548, partial [Viridothelium virens]
ATIADPRFSNIHTDPRFRLPSKKHAKVKLDKRFARMLEDDDFSKKASVDKYGRKVERGAGRKDLERFYRVGESEDEEDDGDKEAEENDTSEADDDDEIRKELAKMDRKYDPAREGGFSESSSDEESGVEEDEGEIDVDEEDIAGDANADIPMGEVSTRLAAVNMDWDHIRAVDLMAVASSFAPVDGKIEKVSVYPSEYGKEQLEREELEGPPPELFGNLKSSNDEIQDDEDEDEDEADERIKKSLLQDDEGVEYSSTALRNYQLSRLRYYYAILTCSSPATAKALYDSMDSREYLTTANFFDLRFVPDDTNFDEAPRDECTKVPDGYRPNEFTTDALTHSKVRLTWDADDAQRKEAQKRAFSRGEIEENDLKAYIGSDSSDDEVSLESSHDERDADAPTGKTNGVKNKADEKRQRMRALLGLSEEPTKTKKRSEDAPVGDLQITFTSGLSAQDGKGSVLENRAPTEETTREKYIRKEKERKARRKEKATAVRAEINLDQSEKGEVNDSKDPFDDPFFTDPKVSAKADNAARKAAAKKKREEREAEEAAATTKRAELELLMVDDKATNGGTLKHFDMNEIEKAEKAARKKRKGKKGKREGQAGGGAAPTDDFGVDVKDPRFTKLYESHEFAIDPTNPRFKGTEGMKKILEEGRKRRKTEDETEMPAKRARTQEHPSELNTAENRDDLQRLVAKVKGKSRK